MRAPPVSPSTELDLIRKRVEVEVETRRRAGRWTSGIIPHTEYQKRPLDWMVDKLGVPRITLQWSLNPEYNDHKWDGTVDPIPKVLQALADWQDVCTESGTGLGKTYLAALVVFWFLACFEDSIVKTIAPREDQVLKHVWKEIGKLWPRFHRHFPYAELFAASGIIRMKPQDSEREVWAASVLTSGVGATEDVATKLQGEHAEHMLFITEETPGLDTAKMEALEQTRTDEHNLQWSLGNPDHQHDPLHLFGFDHFGKPRPGVVHTRWSAFDHPNIVTGRQLIPGAIGPRRLQRRIERLGVGSRLYNSRVRGISPSESADALIKREWCERAAQRYNDERYRVGALGMGIDPSNSEHGDPAAIARGKGACLIEVTTQQCPDASKLGVQVVGEIRDEENPVDPRYVGVDAVGVGASTVNKMKELKVKARFIYSGAKAIPGLDQDTLWSETSDPDEEGKVKAKGPRVVESERFGCKRDQILWRLREDLRLDHIALPHDEELFQDLCTASYETRGGKILVESKEHIIARLGHSPNKGDATALWNWVRRRAPLPVTPEEQPMRDRDRGLERMLDRHQKRERQEAQRFQRAVRRHRRTVQKLRRERR